MRVQVIHHQNDLFRSRVLLRQQPVDLPGPILRRPSFLCVGKSPARQWLGKEEYTRRAVADILVIFVLDAIPLGTKPFPKVSKELYGLFIHADNRICFIVWTAVHFECVFHSGHKGGVVFRGNTSALLQVRIKFVYLVCFRQ